MSSVDADLRRLIRIDEKRKAAMRAGRIRFARLLSCEGNVYPWPITLRHRVESMLLARGVDARVARSVTFAVPAIDQSTQKRNDLVSLRDVVAALRGRSRRPVGPPCDGEATAIYLIGHDPHRGRVKIGVSSDPQRRARSLSTASGVVCVVLASSMACCRSHAMQGERSLHDDLRERRLVGEWFGVTGEEVRRLVAWYSTRRAGVRYSANGWRNDFAFDRADLILSRGSQTRVDAEIPRAPN